MKNRIVAAAIAAMLFVNIFLGIQQLLCPKYMSDIIEGALVGEYYQETTDHDVIFIGDCEVYENFSPITLWEEYGVTSYIRGTPQQLIWQSYYLLEDTLRYETPKAVILNVLSMKYSEPQSEAYNRLTLDGMEPSITKWKAVKASMTEDEQAITYFIPLLRYHSRWSELGGDDFRYFLRRDKKSHNGFVMRIDSNPAGEFPQPPPLGNYAFSDNCWEYLDRMRTLCEKNGIELILIKAPTLYPHWYGEWDEQITAYAEENGLRYLNLIDSAEDAGIDMVNDTYDKGLHLNLAGAEKLTRWFGDYLCNELSLPSHKDDAALSAVWDEKISFYNEMKLDQERELREYGKLISY